MSTLKPLIEKASVILDPYLKKADVKVDSASFISFILNEMGIDDTDVGLEVLKSKSTTFEDFNTAFSNYPTKNEHAMAGKLPNIPTPRLRLAWEVIKSEKTESELSIADLIKSNRPIGQWSDLELLEKYGENCSTEILDELEKRSKGRYCVIFTEDGRVDTENSLYMIRAARNQETSPTFIVKSTGESKEVLRVGEFPKTFLYECPVHSNILLVNGYCEKCDCLWDVDDETSKNVMIRLITDEVSDIRPYRNKSFEELKKEFPKVFLHYKELKELNQLPVMKRKLSERQLGDPFRVTSHRTI